MIRWINLELLSLQDDPKFRERINALDKENSNQGECCNADRGTAPFFSDGFRVVLFTSEQRVAIQDLNFIEWAWP